MKQKSPWIPGLRRWGDLKLHLVCVRPKQARETAFKKWSKCWFFLGSISFFTVSVPVRMGIQQTSSMLLQSFHNENFYVSHSKPIWGNSLFAFSLLIGYFTPVMGDCFLLAEDTRTILQTKSSWRLWILIFGEFYFNNFFAPLEGRTKFLYFY